MIIYLNPTEMTKEAFLKKHGRWLLRDEVANYNLDDHSETCVVCLVDNGPFTAAGIMHGQRDLEDFTDQDDPRFKTFYVVNTKDINAEGGPGRPVS